MNAILAIFSRELRAYFYSPLAYVVLTCFLLIVGLQFLSLLSYLNSQPSAPGAPLEFFFGGTILFWLAIIFVGPVLPMRLLSEERRSGTIEVLMTAPVTAPQVVVGKYLAVLVFYVFLWLPTVTYVGVVASVTDLDWGPVAAAYLGVFGIGALFLALGIFASALARNQLVAAIVAFVFVFLLFLCGLLEFLVPSPTWREILGYLNLLQHMEDFDKGIVDTRRLVYYLSGVIFFLFLTSQALEAKKWR
jgi:ABC-2 type transport system permease protein